MVASPEYTCAAGKLRYAKSPAKSLIYQTVDEVPDKANTYATKAKGEVPFATFDGAESGKYPASFTLPGKGHAGADKVGTLGGRKDFDPEIYRQAIRNYNTSKVAAPRAAYRGAGDILHHPGATGPETQQGRGEGQNAEPAYGGAGQAADVMTFDAAYVATSADSVVPPTEVVDSVAVGAVSKEPELNEHADIAEFAAH